MMTAPTSLAYTVRCLYTQRPSEYDLRKVTGLLKLVTDSMELLHPSKSSGISEELEYEIIDAILGTNFVFGPNILNSPEEIIATIDWESIEDILVCRMVHLV